MRGAMIEAYRSAATVPAMRMVLCRSPMPTTIVGSVAVIPPPVVSFAGRREFQYQAAPAPRITAIRRIPDILRPRFGGDVRGTMVGPGTRAGAGLAPPLGIGALLKNDCICPFPSSP